MVDESILSSDWDIVKQFAADFVNHVGIHRYGSRASFVSYGTDATMHIRCNDFIEESKITNAILSVKQRKNDLEVNNIIGLKTGFNTLNSDGCGARQNIHSRAIIFLTTIAEYSQSLEQLKHQAQLIKNDGIKLLIIGIDSDERILKETFQTKQEELFLVGNYKELLTNNLINKLAKDLCIESRPSTTAKPTTKTPTESTIKRTTEPISESGNLIIEKPETEKPETTQKTILNPMTTTGNPINKFHFLRKNKQNDR